MLCQDIIRNSRDQAVSDAAVGPEYPSETPLAIHGGAKIVVISSARKKMVITAYFVLWWAVWMTGRRGFGRKGARDRISNNLRTTMEIYIPAGRCETGYSERPERAANRCVAVIRCRQT